MRHLWVVLVLGCSGNVDGGMPPGGSPDGPPGGGNTDGGPTPDVPGGVGEPAALQGITLFAVQTATPLPSLTWSPELAATAAAWIAQCVDNQAPTGLIDHNPGRSNGHPYYVGENIYASGGQASARQAADLWVSEVADYDYATNTCNGVCGHYTQVVWRDTLEVGCAVGTCPGLTYPNSIVCNYGPGGNVGGQRPY